jgi:hypothetical protein
VISGVGDVHAIAAGTEAYPWRALVRPLETVVETQGRPICWTPDMVFGLVTHPDRRTWAGVNGSQLYVFRLEGEPKGMQAGLRGQLA